MYTHVFILYLTEILLLHLISFVDGNQQRILNKLLLFFFISVDLTFTDIRMIFFVILCFFFAYFFNQSFQICFEYRSRRYHDLNRHCCLNIFGEISHHTKNMINDQHIKFIVAKGSYNCIQCWWTIIS